MEDKIERFVYPFLGLTIDIESAINLNPQSLMSKLSNLDSNASISTS